MAEDFGYQGFTERHYTSAEEIQEGRMESTKMVDGQMVTTVRESKIVRTNGTERLGKEAKEILLHLIAEIRKKLLGVVEATEAVAAVVPKIIRVTYSRFLAPPTIFCGVCPTRLEVVRCLRAQ